ncbi:MAG: enoyl-CoA hydratase-related protein, partial [Pseudomonadota bacterium]
MLKKTHACFDVRIENKIAHIILSRGDAMNTMTKDFWNELPAIVREIDSQALARVVVISSTGKHFSAGMDLSVFASDGSVSA